MKIYNVIIKDRHTDTTASPFLDKQESIAFARMKAKEYCSFPEDYKEETFAGWLFYARYSCEGDSVWVTEHEI